MVDKAENTDYQKIMAMPPGIKKYWAITLQTFKSFIREGPFRLSAAISYYTIFSLPALLVILIKTLSIFLEEKAVTGQLTQQIQGLIGPESAAEIEEIIRNVSAQESSLLMKIAGFGILLFTATTVFATLQEALNTMWNVKAKPSAGFRKFLLSRLLSFGLVITLGFLLLVSLAVDALLSFLKDFMEQGLLNISYYPLQALSLAISLSVLTVIFAMIYRFLPDVKIVWKDVWAGAFITTVLFTTGKFLIGIYLGNSDFTSTYGAAGSLVIIMVWVYYSSLIILLGAEITQVYARSMGRRIQPSEHAVRTDY